LKHELKTWPESFHAVWDGSKTYEIRKADRPFAVGDTLVLREFIPQQANPGIYTGRAIHAEVTWLNRGDWGLPPDLCVLALRISTKEPAPAQSP
jgi:hypothetical protein